MQYEEQSDSRILYHEESGGLVTSVSPPKGIGSQKRAPIAPLKPEKPSAILPKAAAAPVERRQSREAQAGRPSPGKARVAGSASPTKAPVAGRLISCEQPDEAWAAADALVREGEKERGRALLETLAAGCPSDAVRLTALERARPLVDAAAFDRWLGREAGRVRGIDAERRLQRLTYVHLLERAAATPGGAAPRAAALADSAGPLIVTFRDAPVALSLGWLWLEANDAASASLWFDRARAWAPGLADAARGGALAALAENDHERALTLAEALPASEPQRSSIRRDALLGLAQRAYRSERFVDVLERLDSGAREGPLPRYALAMRAWSLIALGERRPAGEIFAALYREAPDLEAAQGIVAAAQKGDAPIDASLAATEPLASILKKRQAAQAAAKSRFLEARALDPESYAQAGAVSAAQVAGALASRDKSGDPGLSQLRLKAVTTLDAGTRLGSEATLHARVDRMDLDAGTAHPDALIGSAPPGSGAAREIHATRGRVEETRVELRFERSLAIRASLGRAPFGGPLPARTSAFFELAAAPAWGQASVTASSMPVRESVLSYSGMRDPYGGEAWGRVFRHSLEGRALWLAAAPWSAGAHLAVARLEGKGVQDNRYWGGDVSVGRDLGLDGFSYAAVSFGAGVESYERNLSHFTLGHGGYFSPQRYSRVGPALDFMTRENHPWMVRGRLSGGWVLKREDDAPVLPLAPDERLYAGSRGGGREVTLQLSGARQVTPYLHVGFALSRSVSPQYRDKQALLMVRILFEPRRSVVSADLPVLGI